MNTDPFVNCKMYYNNSDQIRFETLFLIFIKIVHLSFIV